MTTLVLDEKIKLSKTHFWSIEELYYFLIESDLVPKLKELDEIDYSQELVDWAQKCLKLKDNDFVNI